MQELESLRKSAADCSFGMEKGQLEKKLRETDIAAKHGKNPVMYGLLSISSINLIILGYIAFTTTCCQVKE